jgi:hypothetical protein
MGAHGRHEAIGGGVEERAALQHATPESLTPELENA